MLVMPPAALRSSGSTTVATYVCRAGTSIWLIAKRSSSTATDQLRVGMSGTCEPSRAGTSESVPSGHSRRRQRGRQQQQGRQRDRTNEQQQDVAGQMREDHRV